MWRQQLRLTAESILHCFSRRSTDSKWMCGRQLISSTVKVEVRWLATAHRPTSVIIEQPDMLRLVRAVQFSTMLLKAASSHRVPSIFSVIKLVQNTPIRATEAEVSDQLLL